MKNKTKLSFVFVLKKNIFIQSSDSGFLGDSMKNKPFNVHVE